LFGASLGLKTTIYPMKSRFDSQFPLNPPSLIKFAAACSALP